MSSIPAAYHDLFERRTFAHLSTVMPDGTPHSTPVWIDYDADRMLVNTARGRRKERNVRETPAVGVSMCDPYRYVSVRGEVTTVTEEGAVEHIDALARRYMDVDEYPNHGEESGPRVLLILPAVPISNRDAWSRRLQNRCCRISRTNLHVLTAGSMKIRPDHVVAHGD